MAAYVAPVQLPPEVTDSEQYKSGIEACAVAYPFIKSLDREWGDSYGDRVYFGMKESAILCSTRDPYRYMTEPIDDPNYECPASKIPYADFRKAWDKKFLSPVCRDWFIDQEATPQHTVVSELYESANTRGDVGESKLAACSPVF